jgi:hypothetical protein
MGNSDGSPFGSEQNVCCIMWKFSDRKTEFSFAVSNYWFEKIALEVS